MEGIVRASEVLPDKHCGRMIKKLVFTTPLLGERNFFSWESVESVSRKEGEILTVTLPIRGTPESIEDLNDYFTPDNSYTMLLEDDYLNYLDGIYRLKEKVTSLHRDDFTRLSLYFDSHYIIRRK